MYSLCVCVGKTSPTWRERERKSERERKREKPLSHWRPGSLYLCETCHCIWAYYWCTVCHRVLGGGGQRLFCLGREGTSQGLVGQIYIHDGSGTQASSYPVFHSPLDGMKGKSKPPIYFLFDEGFHFDVVLQAKQWEEKTPQLRYDAYYIGLLCRRRMWWMCVWGTVANLQGGLRHVSQGRSDPKVSLVCSNTYQPM